MRSRRRKDGSQAKTKYYACGGYITKGNSVCQRSVVRKEVIEAQVFEAIGEQISEFVGTDDAREKLRAAIEGTLGWEGRDDAAELERLRPERHETLRKISNILDNITPAHREFPDRRILELKKELGAASRASRANSHASRTALSRQAEC